MPCTHVEISTTAPAFTLTFQKLPMKAMKAMKAPKHNPPQPPHSPSSPKPPKKTSRSGWAGLLERPRKKLRLLENDRTERVD